MKNDKYSNETVIVCASCGEIVENQSYFVSNGWDGYTKCQGCGEIEGELKEIPLSEYESN
jgi:transcription initiation factor TFIIIB Brf1 subunit/transcription initiation factor TFIIB